MNFTNLTAILLLSAKCILVECLASGCWLACQICTILYL